MFFPFSFTSFFISLFTTSFNSSYTVHLCTVLPHSRSYWFPLLPILRSNLRERKEGRFNRRCYSFREDIVYYFFPGKEKLGNPVWLNSFFGLFIHGMNGSGCLITLYSGEFNPICSFSSDWWPVPDLGQAGDRLTHPCHASLRRLSLLLPELRPGVQALALAAPATEAVTAAYT